MDPNLATFLSDNAEVAALHRQHVLSDPTLQAALTASKPATIVELETAFPDSAAFVLAQAKAGASMNAAKLAHADIVKLELKAAKEEVTKLTAKVTELEAAKSKLKAPGVAAIGTKASGGAGGESVEGDIAARIEAVKAEKKCSSNKAHSIVKAENPEAYMAWVASRRTPAGK